MSKKNSRPPLNLGVVDSLTKEATTPEFAELDRYIISAEGGLLLRENPPSDTNNESGAYAGTEILCMNYGDIFVETKRDNKWSYGNYMGKSGWVCNVYLTKKKEE